jgi:hypothetical protein
MSHGDEGRLVHFLVQSTTEFPLFEFHMSENQTMSPPHFCSSSSHPRFLIHSWAFIQTF